MDRRELLKWAAGLGAAATLARVGTGFGEEKDVTDYETTPRQHSRPREGEYPMPVKVGAYYYPWYPNFGKWDMYLRKNGQRPMLGEYSSADPFVVQQHVDWCVEYGISLLACSWWGANDYTDANMRLLNNTIDSTPGDLKYCILYETKGLEDGKNIIDDLTHVVKTFGGEPRYWRQWGKPVVIVYVARAVQFWVGDIRNEVYKRTGVAPFLIGDEVWNNEPTQQARQWDAVTAYNLYDGESQGYDDEVGVSLWQDMIWARWRSELTMPRTIVIPQVMPGFNNASGKLRGVLPRQVSGGKPETSLFERQLNIAVPDPRIPLVMVTSFNEWLEDTQIEPVIGSRVYDHTYQYDPYGYAYLDIIKRYTQH